MSYCGHIAYVEMMYYSAMCLAYRWAKVSVGKPIFCGLASKEMVTSAAFEVHSYVEYLKKDIRGPPEVHVELDAKMFSEPGQPRKDLEARCKYLLTGYSGAKVGDVARLRKAMAEMAALSAECLDKVKSTICEAVNLDEARVKEHYEVEPKSVTFEGPAETAAGLEEHMTVALNAGVPETWEYFCKPEADVSMTMKVSLSEHLKGLGSVQRNVHDDRTALCDLLYAVGTDVEDIDADIAEVMMALADGLKEDDLAYNKHADMCSKLVAHLRVLSGEDSDVLEAAIGTEFGTLVHDLSLGLGMAKAKKNMIR
jgi:hypothetical protein